MNTKTNQVQGDEVRVDWTIGRAPLALRGIRFRDPEPNDPKPAPPVPAPPAPPAPAPVPQPPAPAPTPDPNTYSADYVKSLREEAKGHRERGEKTAADLAAERTAREAAEARVAEFEKREAAAKRTGAITAAAKDIADADALLDSAAFGNAIDGIDVSDADKLGAAVKAFVEANPRFATAPSAPQRQHGAPTGGGQKGAPSSLGAAINAHYSGS